MLIIIGNILHTDRNKGHKIMVTYEDLLTKKETLALVGLGYVGMPIAVAFSKKIQVIGFDLNEEKVKLYQNDYYSSANSGKGRSYTGFIAGRGRKQTCWTES